METESTMTDEESASDSRPEQGVRGQASSASADPGRDVGSLSEQDLGPPRERAMMVPIVLFGMTCFTTFFAGISHWQLDLTALADPVALRQLILAHGLQGVVYTLCVLSILMTHEMGHFLATVLYRIPASLPYFIPFPSGLGTMGAVIGMRAHEADRRQIFDIGLAGPLAGLVVAVPILWIGIQNLDMNAAPTGRDVYDCPLAVRWIHAYMNPDAVPLTEIRTGQLNPYFMAGWVGLLVTGLNMIPISQLDGGHVVYSMFGTHGRWVARGTLLAAILFVIVAQAYIWSVMIVLVCLMGTDHPPTANDAIPLGWPRFLLGLVSLLIPIVCFPPKGLVPIVY